MKITSENALNGWRLIAEDFRCDDERGVLLMTVAELIALLSRYPPEAEVIFHDEEIAIMQDDTTLDQINESGGLYDSRVEVD